MAKAAALQVLTANRLRDGEVVYWRGGTWVGNFTEAEIFESENEAKRALDEAARYVAERVVVNPYCFAVTRDETGVRPLDEREIIRSEGPSVRRDVGKQARTLTSPDAGRSICRSEAETNRVGGSADSRVGPPPAPSSLRSDWSDLPTKGEVESLHVPL